MFNSMKKFFTKAYHDLYQDENAQFSVDEEAALNTLLDAEDTGEIISKVVE